MLKLRLLSLLLPASAPVMQLLVSVRVLALVLDIHSASFASRTFQGSHWYGHHKHKVHNVSGMCWSGR